MSKQKLRQVQLYLRNHQNGKQVLQKLNVGQKVEVHHNQYKQFQKSGKNIRLRRQQISKWFFPQYIEAITPACLCCTGQYFPIVYERDKNAAPFFLIEKQQLRNQIDKIICSFCNYGFGCIFLASNFDNNLIKKGYKNIQAYEVEEIKYLLEHTYSRLNKIDQIGIRVEPIPFNQEFIIRISIEVQRKRNKIKTFVKEGKNTYGFYELKQNIYTNQLEVVQTRFKQNYDEIFKQHKFKMVKQDSHYLHRCKFTEKGVHIELSKMTVLYGQSLKLLLNQTDWAYKYFLEVNLLNFLPTASVNKWYLLLRSKSSQNRDIISSINSYLSQQCIHFHCLNIENILSKQIKNLRFYSQSTFSTYSYILYCISEEVHVDLLKGQLNRLSKPKQKNKQKIKQKIFTFQYYFMYPIIEAQLLGRPFQYLQMYFINKLKHKINVIKLGQKHIFDMKGNLKQNLYLFVTFCIHGVLVRHKQDDKLRKNEITK